MPKASMTSGSCLLLFLRSPPFCLQPTSVFLLLPVCLAYIYSSHTVSVPPSSSVLLSFSFSPYRHPAALNRGRVIYLNGYWVARLAVSCPDKPKLTQSYEVASGRLLCGIKESERVTSIGTELWTD